MAGIPNLPGARVCVVRSDSRQDALVQTPPTPVYSFSQAHARAEPLAHFSEPLAQFSKKSRADYKALPPPAMRAGNARQIFVQSFLAPAGEKMCFSGRVVPLSIFVQKLRALGAHGVSSVK